MDSGDKFDSKFSDVCMNFFMDNFIEGLHECMLSGENIHNLRAESILRYPFFVTFPNYFRNIKLLNTNIGEDKKISSEDIIRIAEEHKCDSILSLFRSNKSTPELFEKYLPEIRKRGKYYLNIILDIVCYKRKFRCEFFRELIIRENLVQPQEFITRKEITEKELIEKCENQPTYIFKAHNSKSIPTSVYLFHLNRLYPRLKRKMKNKTFNVRRDMTFEQFEKYSHIPWDMKTLTEILDIEYIKKHPEIDWKYEYLINNPTLRYEDCLKILGNQDFPEQFYYLENLTFKQFINLSKRNYFEGSSLISANKFSLEKKIRQRIFDQGYLIKFFLDLDF